MIQPQRQGVPVRCGDFRQRRRKACPQPGVFLTGAVLVVMLVTGSGNRKQR